MQEIPGSIPDGETKFVNVVSLYKDPTHSTRTKKYLWLIKNAIAISDQCYLYLWVGSIVNKLLLLLPEALKLYTQERIYLIIYFVNGFSDNQEIMFFLPKY